LREPKERENSWQHILNVKWSLYHNLLDTNITVICHGVYYVISAGALCETLFWETRQILEIVFPKSYLSHIFEGDALILKVHRPEPLLIRSIEGINPGRKSPKVRAKAW
jgi:hypothetical protein